MFKLKLNNLCQKQRWAAPAYTDRRVGPYAATFHTTILPASARMFKLKPNNLCQKQWWAAPEYTDWCEDPDHASTFHATVIVSVTEESNGEMWEVGSGVREAPVSLVVRALFTKAQLIRYG